MPQARCRSLFNVFVHVSLIPSVGQCLAQVFCRGSEESGEIDHLAGHAAVYNYVCSIYEVVAGAGRGRCRPGQCLGVCPPFLMVLQMVSLADLFGASCVDPAGGYAVDGDSEFRKRHHEGVGERRHPSFACRVCLGACLALDVARGGDADHASAEVGWEGVRLAMCRPEACKDESRAQVGVYHFVESGHGFFCER